MTEVTKTTIHKNSWITIRDLLRANVTDPKSRAKYPFFYQRIPLTASTDFRVYPFVVIAPVTVSENFKTFTNLRDHMIP